MGGKPCSGVRLLSPASVMICAGAGRLVTFAASPSDRPAFGGPSGGLFTRSLAAAIDGDPATFAMLARKQLAAARGTPASAGSTVLGGEIGAAFFFAGTVPGPLEFAARLDPARILPDGNVGELNLVAAMRPLTVDLLVATGMPFAEAQALLPRV